MTGQYRLPDSVLLEGREFAFDPDFRTVLQVLQVLDDNSLPELIRWQVALHLFYRAEVPRHLQVAAMEYLAQFLQAGSPPEKGGHKLFDWQQDANLIISGVNRAAGTELRAVPFVHWWTFLSWFHAMDQGQFSTVVGIRDKLRRGKKLEAWETEFYRRNKSLVELKSPLSPQEQAYKQQLQQLLEGR